MTCASAAFRIRRCDAGQPDGVRVLRRAGSAIGQPLADEWAALPPSADGDRWLWLAESPATVHAAALLLACPGRTALLFIWPVDRPLDERVVAALAQAAVDHADPARISIIQLLLQTDPSPLSRGLAAAGFVPLAALDYMQRATTCPPATREWPPGFSLHPYRPAVHDLFARTILASYEQTLDCPALLGTRNIDDVIAGHKATGRFLPELWLVLCHGDQGVGVMLLNLVDRTDDCELVYLGLAVSHRGRGLASALVRHGLKLARQQGAAQMLLAVDRQNHPALRLYRSLQFVTTTTRFAWIKATR